MYKRQVHCALNDFGELLRLDDICSAVNRDLFGNQFFQEFDCKILLLHVCHFFKERRIEQRKLSLDIREKVEDVYKRQELQKLVDSHVDSYKEDFDIDKRIIRRTAESRNPEDNTLMWFCRPHGTHCLNENQVFIQGTRDHNTFRFYAEQTYDECVARVIVLKTVKRGKVFGDVFEINYREQAANVAQNSVAPDHDRLTFADGFVLDAPCRSSFDAAMALGGEHGGVKTHQTLPKDADALAEVLSKQKTRRDRLPEAERTEALSPLPVAELRKYEAVKKAHPDALVCFAQNGYCLLYTS